MLRGDKAAIGEMKKRHGLPNRPGRTNSQAKRGSSKNSKNPKNCSRCGKGPHPRDQCPAKDATCHKCGKKGHYSQQCFTKQASEVVGENHLESAFLDKVSSSDSAKTSNGTTWLATIQLNGHKTLFKLDTGAEVRAISREAHQNLGKPPLLTPRKTLYGPSRQPLSVKGQFQGHFTHKKQATVQEVFVLEGLKTNLLGLPAIEDLNLAVRVDSVATMKAVQPDILEKFESIFQGLGNLGEEFHITLKPEAKPYCLNTPRHVPLPLKGKVKAELDRMESIGVISKVDEATSWCAGMVVVPKKDGTIRICVDLKPLNQSLIREIHPLPKVDDTLRQLTGTKVFSKLDANSGFWQIPLSRSSRPLTTFITPAGRYWFNKLPFGISSAPEHFQKRMSQILSGLDGVLCLMDDVLIFGRSQKEHDDRLTNVLKRIQTAGITLNPSKCEFSRCQLKFLGHLIDGQGIRADPEKTAAIQEMPPPTNVSELRRVMGMINQLGKFSSRIADLSQPLRSLLSKRNSWLWTETQDKAFVQIKDELSKPTVLALYNPQASTKISADASSYGLGAVLLQKHEETWKPIAYASRSMSDTEQRYAQIEKEALAVTWACEKFSSYVLGMHFTIETDHKPLIPLLGSKSLDSLPPRVLRFRLRLSRFDYDIVHIQGSSSTHLTHYPEHQLGMQRQGPT